MPRTDRNLKNTDKYRTDSSSKPVRDDERYGKELLKKNLSYRPEEGDCDDFDTFAYVYKSQSYIRSPMSSGHKIQKSPKHGRTSVPKNFPERYKPVSKHSDQRSAQPKHSSERRSSSSKRYTEHRYSPPKQYSAEQIDKIKAHPRGTTKEHRSHRYRSHKQFKQPTEERDSDREKDTLNLAATKIQAIVRGHQARKVFWREMEHHREEQNRERHSYSKNARQDDHSFSSMTSIVDNHSVASIASNADPNVGLTAPLHTLDSAQKNQIIRELKSKLIFSDEIPTANQLQAETSPIILVLGGINPDQSDDYIIGGSMFTYNIEKSRWLFGGTMPEPRNYHRAVYLNGKVIVTGGYSPLQVVHGEMVSTQSTFQLTVKSKRWRKRTDMHQPRACHGMCVVEENIWVLGGRDNNGKLLSTVEVYYPKRDIWLLQKHMPEAIMGMACTVMDNCVWVIGGIVEEHPSKYAVSSRCYIFDIQQQNWFHKSSLPEPRAFGCAVTLKREIWLWCGVKDDLGGDGSLVSTNTVFLFNPEVNQWERRDSIGTPKHGMAVVKCGRRVFLLGGISNTSGNKEVLIENDYFNRETNQYSERASLPYPITGSAAVPLPIDYVPSSDPIWNMTNIDETILNDAATRIQAVYRGFKTRSSLSKQKFPLRSLDSNIIKRATMNYMQQSEAYGTKWRLYQRVKIDDWPPLPDPKCLPSELNVRLGTLPKGYTVTAASNTGRTKIRRYVQLPEHADPNLSVCGHISNIYKKTKKILGLRKVEHMPAFTRNMLTVTTLQDDSLPTVLLMGGLQPKEPVNMNYGKLIMRYHPLKNRWEYFGILPESRNYHAAIYYKEYIYVTGGCDPDTRNCGEMVATKSVYCLNIHSSEWEQRTEMNCCRSHHCLIPYQNRIYAIGGRDHNGRLVASIEAYDIAEDKWIQKHAMSQPRMGMACAIYQESIWCMGGMTLSEDTQSLSYPVLTSVISYDIADDSWKSRPPLRCPRVFGTCVLVRNEMWLFGGASKDRDCNSLISMASVDKYYPDEAQWMRKTLLNTPRHSAAVVAVESCVYTFGGMSSQEWSALSKNEMVVLNDCSLHNCVDLPVPLTGLAAVVVPPVSPSLRAESVALLLHAQLTF